MNRILSYLILMAVALGAGIALSSCEDRLDYPGGPIEPGISTVNVQVGFKAFTPALDSRAAGDAIKNIKTLWLVIYDKEGKLVRKQQVTDFTPEKLDENARPDGDASSETQTGHVQFKLTIDNGYYRIFAVANHDLSDVSDEALATADDLRKLDLQWKSGDPGQNAQMFGWFVEGDKNSDQGTSTGVATDAPLLAIRDSSTQLHAWVRRAASKLTIAFNTTHLSEYVRIYLKSITVKDVPTHCLLGADNTPVKAEELTDGETIYFGNAKAEQNGKDHHNSWKYILSGDSVYGLVSDLEDAHPKGMLVKERLAREHSEEARALYFYENLQGKADLTNCPWEDKRQDVTGGNKQVSYPDGTDPNDKAWKDGKKCGTYIEIHAYYVNEGGETPGHGDIIYRFMLGKNITDDFNAERNHHYKLTMYFNGNANDIDFHIDYKEEAKPGFFVPETTYVSYLYNQESSTTLRATPRPGYDLLSLKAYILENEWRPTPDEDNPVPNDMYNSEAWTWQTNFSNSYAEKASSYTRPTSKYNPTWTDYEGIKHTETGAKNTEFGYLSLRKVTRQVYELGGGGDKAQFVDKIRKLYFLGDPNGSGTSMNKSRGYRDYGTMPNTDGTTPGGDATDGFFTITRRVSNLTTDVAQQTHDYIIDVPLYTRAKSIDSWAVYSGANPYYRHHRKARVIFIATYQKKDTSVPGPSTYQDAGITTVLQARRIDNPRAIYRRRENKEPFNVLLCYNKKSAQEQLEDAQGINPFGVQIGEDGNPVLDELGDPINTEQIYEAIESRGPWKATIERDPHGLVKLTKGTQTATGEGGVIYGRNGTPIEFVYTPNAVPKSGDAYGAIITVRYHNYSCTHKIIVRQGYDAHDINGGPNWSVFNVYDETSITKSPLSIGSTYRRNSTWGNLIKESNNKRGGRFVVESYPGFDAKIWLHGNDTGLAWRNIPHDEGSVTGDFFEEKEMTDLNGNKHKYRLPKSTELPNVGIYYNKSDGTTTDETVEDKGNAFGICYADGATRTLLTKDAYSFYDPNNTIKDSPKGVRGVVIYSVSNGDNVFFPFGCYGNPRRRRNGFLQYGSVEWTLVGGANNYRPMAYDLKSQVGAAYWIATTDKERTAIDYNGGNYMASFLNMDVYQPQSSTEADYNKGRDGGTGSHADALPIKLIRTDL